MVKMFPSRRAGGGERGNLGSPLTYNDLKKYKDSSQI
jgi:hypothetical protein